MPNLLRPSHVPDALLADMVESCGEAFVVSYLSGAAVSGRVLVPWTETAEIRLRRSRDAMAVIERAGLKLERAIPFGSANHPASMGVAA